MTIVSPTPTKRAVLDIGRLCNLHCSFCYFRHSDAKGHASFATLQRQAAAALKRGNEIIELTGGEPTLLPFIEDFLVYLKRLSARTSIITNGVVLPAKAHSIIAAGIDEFFISLHGSRETHDRIVGLNGAREKQETFLEILKERSIPYHFNFVVTRDTADDIPVIVEIALKWHIRTISFVNFNPQQGWVDDVEGTRKIVADLYRVGPMLDRAIEKLESAGIGANVRFFPMCRLSAYNRKNVCNDLHVSFDPNEWDYEIKPKTFAAHRLWGRTVSKLNQNKREPCNCCDLQNICGGINVNFHKATDGKMATSVELDHDSDKDDFYYYRKHCVLSLL